MAIQTIDLGSIPLDGTDGDNARQAFTKVNANFQDLNTRKVEVVAGKQLSTNDYTNADKSIVNGVQSGLDGRQPLNAKLTAIAESVWAANQLIYTTGGSTVSTTPLTQMGRDLISSSSVTDLWKKAEVKPSLPVLSDNNFTYNFEGDTPSQWMMSNTSAGVSSSTMRITKSVASGTSASARSAISMPGTGDFIIYGRVSTKQAADCVSVIWLLNGSKELAIWFGTANGSSTYTAGAISIVGTTGTNTRNALRVPGTFNYETTPVEFALQLDTKYNQLYFWYKESDNLWKFGQRVACDWFSSAEITAAFTTASALNSWIDIDYLSIGYPNIVVWGDSIAEGKNLYSPNPILNLTTWSSHWASQARLYPGLRNTLPVIKGVGGRSSAEMLSALGEIELLKARLVFYHMSSNDLSKGVTQASRSTATQTQVTRLLNKSSQIVILNSLQGTSTSPDNTGVNKLRDYTNTWWTNSKDSITGVYTFIDIAQALALGDYQDPALTQADGLHPNPAGAAKIGQRIGLYYSPLINTSREILPLSMGGTGANSPVGVRNSIGLGTAATSDILGVVSQSSGIPTGAIIEKGNNSNGEYVRFADGTQICISPSLSISSTTASGSIFVSTEVTWDLPASFVNTNYVVLGGNIGNSQSHWCTGKATTITSAAASAFSAVSISSRPCRFCAIGRWY